MLSYLHKAVQVLVSGFNYSLSFDLSPIPQGLGINPLVFYEIIMLCAEFEPQKGQHTITTHPPGNLLSILSQPQPP